MFSSTKVNRIVDECEKLIATKDDAWSINRQSATFIMELALMRRAKVIVEVGTSYGHSGLFLADAAFRNRGKFFTAEKEPRKVLIAKQYFVQAGLDGVATILEGTAPGVLSSVPEGIDFLFVDATKTESGNYLDALWSKLADRAVIVTDNATSHEQELGSFLQRLRTDTRLISTLVPIGHGMELTVRVA